MQLTLPRPAHAQADNLCFAHARKLDLGRAAWAEFVPACALDHQSLFEELYSAPVWTQQNTRMYERDLAVPRLLGKPAVGLSCASALATVQEVLSLRYGRRLESLSFALYRDGRDSVAMHGDKMGPLRDDTVVAVLSLGCARTFLLKPAAGGRSLRFHLGEGDLFVMGGSCQRDWLHGVPKSRAASGPRISVMLREVVPEPLPDTAPGAPDRTQGAQLLGWADPYRGSLPGGLPAHPTRRVS
jgi:hypothetical protein